MSYDCRYHIIIINCTACLSGWAVCPNSDGLFHNLSVKRFRGVCIARSEPDGTRWRTGGGKWSGKMRMEWVASSLALYVGTRSIQLLSADPHSSTASSWLNWHPRRFKWTHPFRWKTKSGFCACAITFWTCYTSESLQVVMLLQISYLLCVEFCNFLNCRHDV